MNSTKVQLKPRLLMFDDLLGRTDTRTAGYIVPFTNTSPLFISSGCSGTFIVVLNSIVIRPDLSMLKILAPGKTTCLACACDAFKNASYSVVTTLAG